MPDKDMTVMVKTLIEQNKAKIETVKTHSDKNEITGPSTWLKDQLKYSNKVQKS